MLTRERLPSSRAFLRSRGCRTPVHPRTRCKRRLCTTATPVTVNQEQNGGQRVLLGTFTLNAGSGHTVVLTDQGDGYVIADAVKIVPDGAAPSTATWIPAIPATKAYRVYARWTAHPNRATDATRM